MTVYRLKYMFDAGSGICLWAANDAAHGRFGYPVDADGLPLSEGLSARVRRLLEWYDRGLDWDDPGGPSPWDAAEEARFGAEARAVLAALRAELGPEFEIEDRSGFTPSG
jgi:hypothetical protein